MINLVDWIPKNIEYAVIGGVILAGAIGDEIAKRIVNTPPGRGLARRVRRAPPWSFKIFRNRGGTSGFEGLKSTHSFR